MTPDSITKKPWQIELFQSLIVAFVFAMVFRGFVVEGFVIPTGSMAPTLFGTHLMKHSDQTGQDFAVGFDNARAFSPDRFSDPLLGRRQALSMREAKTLNPRSGDRVLVLKPCIHFLNQSDLMLLYLKILQDTQGPSANYIKRLIGLPGETIWIADGDVFAQKDGGEFEIQRKPLHIQKALWRPVSNSDAVPINTLALARPWKGPPWKFAPQIAWEFKNRTWTCSTSDQSTLTWNSKDLLIDDWLPYNMLMPAVKPSPATDIRVSATITPDSEDITIQFSLDTAGLRFSWILQGKQGALLILDLKTGQGVFDLKFDHEGFQSSKPTRMECWHVDQAMYLFINDELIASLPYEIDPEQRIRMAKGATSNADVQTVMHDDSEEPRLKWTFMGSPFTITKVNVDHDLYYRDARIPSRATKNPTKTGNELLVRSGTPAFGTHPDKLAVLGADQFLMAGDNSAYSLDGRLWGNPDEFVAAQIDDTPFVVHRDLLIGKAWSVYWPAPLSAGPVKLIPDFGRIRFIR